jgi:AmmeMemoRadiSam system protein B/AmmeMemoRadiSam system protein A
VNDVQHQSTYCPNCGKLLIERDWYDLGAYDLRGDRCRWCDEQIPGRFGDQPGNWGRRRQPIDISRFSPPGNSTGTRTPQLESPVPSTGATAASGLPESRKSSSPVGNNGPKTGNLSLSCQPQLGHDNEGIDLTSQQHRTLHALASEIVAAAIQQRTTDPERSLAEIADHYVYGAYVSLKRQQRLRSCCGFVNQRMPLYSAIVEAATRTASHDVRLPPISASELPYLELETWLLDKTQPVLATGRDRVHAVEVGRHGLLIVQGTQRGLLLPGVAVEHEYDAETFLAQVCRKAGIRSDAWLSDDTQLFVFEATSYRAPIDPRAYQEGDVDSPALYTGQQLAQLQEWLTSNFVHALRGSTPNYYLPTLPDAMVQLAGLSMTHGTQDDQSTICRVSLRPAMPLQATLCQLAELAAESFIKQGKTTDDLMGPVDLIIGHDSAMHHTLADPDLAGFDPARRGLFATNRQSWAVVYRPQDSTEAVVAELRGRIGEPTLLEQTQIYSLLLQSTRTPCGFGSRPASIRASENRLPAVAGRFYPAEPDALQDALTELFRGLSNQPRYRPSAVMVPHAGWMYSGRVAAEVLAGVEIPDRVIVIGPKHTSAGVDYAVAPQRTWRLPGIELENDRELAQQLIDRIPSWEWDAAAHMAEHAIEVELPLLHHLAPDCRVVGVALGIASWEKCLEFAAGLATLLREGNEVPLLVISSDMNHFATDEENRRLDEFALRALESRDPKYAYHAIRERRISMCGLIPAVVVMQALAEIGRLRSVERVNYATSGDVTGDRRRVVGYAGLRLFS